MEKWWIARVEPYVDSEGVTKWAITYGLKYTELSVWYHLEEIKNFFHAFKIKMGQHAGEKEVCKD